ncbi:MAG: hypothetical protein A2277_06355 [Desulfobacterales bacterium RIFOXYA12_FULL_46_15]|nr:MAG: hypothetical protein A2277_06355 [Desulfobacterales bacterium RIFOXYA12_FULL_46_15]
MINEEGFGPRICVGCFSSSVLFFALHANAFFYISSKAIYLRDIFTISQLFCNTCRFAVRQATAD